MIGEYKGKERSFRLPCRKKAYMRLKLGPKENHFKKKQKKTFRKKKIVKYRVNATGIKTIRSLRGRKERKLSSEKGRGYKRKEKTAPRGGRFLRRLFRRKRPESLVGVKLKKGNNDWREGGKKNDSRGNEG